MANTPPGLEFRSFGPAYGLEDLPKHYGTGYNMLRTAGVCQPRALRVGDILATGDKVLSLPREGGNGTVLIHITGGHDGHWVGVPGRIPIALRAPEES